MPGDLFQPTKAELVDQYLRDVRLGAYDADPTAPEPPTQPGSDNFITANCVAQAVVQNYMNVNSAEAAANVLDAEGEDLDRIREADGLPKVEPTKSSGKLVVTILGATTILNGTPFVMPNGLTGTVVGTFVNPADQSSIDVQSTDTGTETNLAGGTKVRFSPAPLNVQTEATVSEAFPLRGGSSGEDDSRKRDRILNARRNRPGGGNWGQLRQWGLDAVASVQEVYVYPALGGPGSCKVVPVRRYDFDFRDFSRVLGAAELQAVRSFIQTKMPIPEEVVVQAVADEALDVTLTLALPESALAGGSGQGWLDPAPWPPTPSAAVTITAVSASNDVITVDAATSTSPIEGLTHVSWWSPDDREFQTRLVTDVTGSSGAWVLTLDAPLLSKGAVGPASGDFVSPAAYNLESYALEWMRAFEGFGPGENTEDESILPRALRHPFVTDEDPTDVTNATIAAWKQGFPEITNFALLYSNLTTPSIPASLATAPNILVPRRFAIYQL